MGETFFGGKYTDIKLKWTDKLCQSEISTSLRIYTFANKWGGGGGRPLPAPPPPGYTTANNCSYVQPSVYIVDSVHIVECAFINKNIGAAVSDVQTKMLPTNNNNNNNFIYIALLLIKNGYTALNSKHNN